MRAMTRADLSPPFVSAQVFSPPLRPIDIEGNPDKGVHSPLPRGSLELRRLRRGIFRARAAALGRSESRNAPTHPGPQPPGGAMWARYQRQPQTRRPRLHQQRLRRRRRGPTTTTCAFSTGPAPDVVLAAPGRGAAYVVVATKRLPLPAMAMPPSMAPRMLRRSSSGMASHSLRLVPEFGVTQV